MWTVTVAKRKAVEVLAKVKRSAEWGSEAQRGSRGSEGSPKGRESFRQKVAGLTEPISRRSAFDLKFNVKTQNPRSKR